MFVRRAKRVVFLSCFASLGMFYFFVSSLNPVQKMEHTLAPTSAAVSVDHQTLDDIDQDPLMNSRIITRHNHLVKICKQQNSTENLKFTESHLYVDDPKEFLFCAVPGAMSSFLFQVIGSTTLRRLENGTAPPSDLNYRKQKLLMSYGLLSAHMKSKKSKMYLKSQDYHKALFVRNPFARILSIYLKIFKHGLAERDRQIGILVKGIVAKRNIKNRAKRTKDAKSITFETFVGFVLQKNNQVKHFWRPVVKSCAPCEMDYDYLGKIETLEGDLVFFLDTLSGYSEQPAINFQKVKSEIEATNNLMESYWKSIPSELLQKFTEAYKQDFITFGYSRDLQSYFLT